MMLELQYSIIILSLPHPLTPSHPHSTTGQRGGGLSKPLILTTIAARGVALEVPRPLLPHRYIRPMFTLYTCYCKQASEQLVCKVFILFCGESEKNEKHICTYRSVFVCMYKIVYVFDLRD